MLLDVISIPPQTGSPTGLIVALHGWGGYAQDLASLAPFLNLPDYQFIFPNAPLPHPRVSGGRMWFDLDTRDYPGFVQSQQHLNDWLQSLESTTGIPLSRTVLGGFSQGGGLTLEVGSKLPLAGLIILSGYWHFPPQAADKTPPILMVHGTQDNVAPISVARQVRDNLTANRASLQYQEYNMGHEIQPAVLQLIRTFILGLEIGK